jgi:hypothetical protein
MVGHDLGAARHILAWAAESPRETIVMMEGPASALALSLGIQHGPFKPSLLANCDWLLVGTGWQSHVEVNAIREAKILGLRVVAVLDHWVNYRERFSSLGDTHWPDIYVVTDAYAKVIASRIFGDDQVVQWPNSELTQLSKVLAGRRIRQEGGGHLVIAGEPVFRSTQTSDGQPEGRLVRDAMRIRCALALGGTVTEGLVLRLHPTEAKTKYATSVQAAALKLEVKGPEEPVSQSLAKAGAVVGINSSLLFTAHSLGIPTYSLAEYYGVAVTLPPKSVPQLFLI